MLSIFAYIGHLYAESLVVKSDEISQMIDGLRCFDRIQSSKYPLTRLLKARVKFEKELEKCDDVARRCLKKIALPEEAKISSFINELKSSHNLKATTEKFNWKLTFDKEILEGVEIVDSERNRKYMFVMVYFTAILWSIDGPLENKILLRVIAVLKRIYSFSIAHGPAIMTSLLPPNSIFPNFTFFRLFKTLTSVEFTFSNYIIRNVYPSFKIFVNLWRFFVLKII